MKMITALILALVFLPTNVVGQSTSLDPTSLPSASTPSSNSGSLSKFLFDKGKMVAQSSKPSMFRDFVQNEWLYGAMYTFYVDNQTLPRLLPASLREKVQLPPVTFSAGLMAPTGTLQGTPVISTSIDLTGPMRAGLLLGLSKLPGNLQQHLQVITDALQTDANGAGILTIGGAGGRDFNQGLWRGGVAMNLSVKWGGVRAPRTLDNTDVLLAPGHN